MEANSKIAFENSLGNLFNEIWLTRLLRDFYHNYLLDTNNIESGMMFELKLLNVSGRTLSADELDISEWISEPFVVNDICKCLGYGIIRFQPLWLNLKDTRVWKNTWKIMKTDSYNDHDSYYLYCTFSWAEIKIMRTKENWTGTQTYNRSKIEIKCIG
jgi:hypothetical protein